MPSLQTTETPLEAARRPRRNRRPRILVAAEPRYLAQRQPAGLAAALVRTGHPAAFLAAEHVHSVTNVDLLVARGRSPALLDLLSRAEALGVPTLNRRAAVEAVLDKGAMARALAAAGLPTPPSHVGPIAGIAAWAASRMFPLVVKPVRGDNARDVRVLRTRQELDDLRWPEPVALAQPFVPGDGWDLKLYVAGERVWAVRKPSPIGTAPDGAPRPVPAGEALRSLALRCGRLFGLDLYGVDCIAGPEGPVVIEVNDFPNYSGLPGADAALAALCLARATRRRS